MNPGIFEFLGLTFFLKSEILTNRFRPFFEQLMPVPQVFDFIVLILIGYLTLRGAMRGIVAQIMSIVSIVASWIIAVKFSPVVAPMVSDEPPWNKLIAMLILFIASYLAIWLIRGLLDDILKAIRLKNADSSLGALLGFAKGVLLCLIITFFLVIFSPTSRDFVLESISGKYFAAGIEKISVMIPEDVKEVLSNSIAKFHGLLEEKPVSDSKLLDTLLADKVTETVNQAKGSITSIFSNKDLQTQAAPQPSPVREKITSSPVLPVELPEPAEAPRRVVLPFQPK